MKRLTIALGMMICGVAGAQDSIGDIGDYYGETQASRQALLDATHDYEVYSAQDVTGETEHVILARFADGSWDFVHKYEQIGTADHGFTEVDRGVYDFSSWWAAYRFARDLREEGEITEFEVVEQAKAPDWVYEGAFPTRAEADDYADDIEYWSAEFGAPRITKVVAVGRSLKQLTVRK